VHPFFDDCLAGEAYLDAVVARKSIHGGAGATDSTAAAGPSNVLVTGVFDRLHDREAVGYVVPLAHYEDGNEFRLHSIFG